MKIFLRTVLILVSSLLFYLYFEFITSIASNYNFQGIIRFCVLAFLFLPMGLLLRTLSKSNCFTTLSKNENIYILSVGVLTALALFLIDPVTISIIR